MGRSRSDRKPRTWRYNPLTAEDNKRLEASIEDCQEGHLTLNGMLLKLRWDLVLDIGTIHDSMMERLGQLYPREGRSDLIHRCGGLLQILGREFGQAARIYSILWLYPDDEAKRSVDKLTDPYLRAWMELRHKD